MKSLLLPRCVLIFLLVSFYPLSASIIVDYTASVNDRFASGYPSSPVENSSFLDAYFPSNSFDFSGVGWSTTNSSNSVALISNQHFLTAKHNKPTGSLNFLNQDGNIVTFSIDSGGYHDLYHSNPSNPGTSTIADLHVGTLTTSIVSADKIISYAVAVGNEIDFIGLTTVMYGKAVSGGSSPVAGINQIAGIQTFDDVTGLNYNDQTRTYITQYNSGSSGDYIAESGDSGSPSFLVNNGSLVLLGTHMAIGKSSEELTEPDLTLDSSANYYSSQISSILTTDGESLSFVAVPEPRLIGIAFGVFALLFSWRKRSV